MVGGIGHSALEYTADGKELHWLPHVPAGPERERPYKSAGCAAFVDGGKKLFVTAGWPADETYMLDLEKKEYASIV